MRGFQWPGLVFLFFSTYGKAQLLDGLILRFEYDHSSDDLITLDRDSLSTALDSTIFWKEWNKAIVVKGSDPRTYELFKVVELHTIPRYRLARISVDPKLDTITQRKLAAEIVQAAQNGEPFEKLWEQYAYTRSEAELPGGDLGWISLVSKPTEIENWLQYGEKGDVTWVETRDGIHVLKMVDHARDYRESIKYRKEKIELPAASVTFPHKGPIRRHGGVVSFGEYHNPPFFDYSNYHVVRNGREIYVFSIATEVLSESTSTKTEAEALELFMRGYLSLEHNQVVTPTSVPDADHTTVEFQGRHKNIVVRGYATMVEEKIYLLAVWYLRGRRPRKQERAFFESLRW